MKKIRAWAKSFVWRFIGIWLLGLLSFLITKSWKETTFITLSFHFLRVIMYYFHEEAWENIPIKYDLMIFSISFILVILSFEILLIF